MKWLADENVPATSVRLLREAGWDVAHVREHHAGISDAEVLALAVRESRALLTFDRDFGELVFHKGMTCPPAVVYLRVVPTTPTEPAELLLAMLAAAPKVRGYFLVLDRETIRRRPIGIR